MNELSIIGIAFRARKAVSGEDLVLDAIRKKKAKIVFLASDAGINTTKRITDKCAFYNVLLNNSFSCEQLSKAVGQTNRMVIAITNEGLKNSILKK